MKIGKRAWKRISLVAGLIVIGIPTFFGVANVMVLQAGKGKIYEDKNAIPHHRVGIVLGCSPRIGYFKGRMDAAAQLYKSGKIDRILVTGDNAHENYDEPTAMEAALVKRGVLKEHIVKDYAGFRTLDSMVRAKKVFNLSDATIITDDFHMARSIYYAENAGMQVDGFPSHALLVSSATRMEVREVFARTQAVIDEIVDSQPKFLGKLEVIP